MEEDDSAIRPCMAAQHRAKAAEGLKVREGGCGRMGERIRREQGGIFSPLGIPAISS